jgi:hypothetical protein
VTQPILFFVALKCFGSKAAWYASEARFNLKLQQRSSSTRTTTALVKNEGAEASPFLYFDSATMLQYQYPSKASETVFCRRQQQPLGCETGGRGYKQDMPNFPLSLFEVKKSGVGEHAGRGVFALVDIPAWSYLGMESGVRTVYYAPDTWNIIDIHYNGGRQLFVKSSYSVLAAYAYGYGFQDEARVSSGCLWFRRAIQLLAFTSLFNLCLSW